jgi:hypothetical protein
VLFVGALDLFRVADSVRRHPITEVLPRLDERWPSVRTLRARRAVRACQRAGPRAARWFGSLDTCLTRSMVAATMLKDRSQVRIAIGFRPTEDRGVADGHAWLAVANRAFQLSTPPNLEPEPYTCLAEIPLETRPDIAAPRDNLARRRLPDGSGVVLDLDGSTVLRTNPTAAALLEAIDRGITGIAPLAAILTDCFDVDEKTARRDVEAFLTALSSTSARTLR